MRNSIEAARSFYARTAASLGNLGRGIPALKLLTDTLEAYSRDEMGTLAAALAYYLLLSLFPLLLLLIAIATPFLASEEVIRQTVRFATEYFPSAGRELRTVLEQILNARGPATVLASLGLLWSASGAFDLIQRGMNKAWKVAHPRPLWRQRLVSIATVLGLGLLFGLSFVTSTIFRSGLRFRFELGGASIEIVGLIITISLNFVLFSVVYKVFPFRQVNFGQVWIGALVASVSWEIAKILFVLYLLNFSRLNLVYGSVGAVIGLLLWGYITASILFFGGELSAVYSRARL